MNMVHQFGNQFKNQNGIQIKKKERKTEKKRKEEKASQPRLLGFAAQPAQTTDRPQLTQPAQLAAQRIAHARAPICLACSH